MANKSIRLRRDNTQETLFSWIKFYQFINRPGMIFAIGAIIGAVFFGLFYGYNLVDFNQTSWIFTNFAHDTGQHQLGWSFFANGNNGGRITTLAYPVGIPITFMDSIPLFAFVFKLFGFSATQQYFGLFGLLSYILFGALAALIVRWIFIKIRSFLTSKAPHFDDSTLDQTQVIFVALGTILMIISPLLIARTFYHTGLSAQWLILLGFLLILYRNKIFVAGQSARHYRWKRSPKTSTLAIKMTTNLANAWRKFCHSSWGRFVAVWSLVLIMVTLIHPYFLPGLVVMLVINFVLLSRNIVRPHDLRNLRAVTRFRANFRSLRREKTSVWQMVVIYFMQLLVTLFYVAKFVIFALLPAMAASAVFGLIGGFSLGGATGVNDLTDKGFNFLSFIMPGGYSALLPGATGDGAKSGSPETMMWLGAGVLMMLIIADALWLINWHARRGTAQKTTRHQDIRLVRRSLMRQVRHFGRWRFWIIALTVFGLLLFALSPSIQIGAWELVHYPVPRAILSIWSAFRAAAREAWPFYYAVQFFAIYIFTKQFFILTLNHNFAKTKRHADDLLTVFTLIILACVALQFSDIYLSPNAQHRTQNFARFATHTADYQFPLELSNLTNKKHLVDLDATATGDLSGFNILGQTAIVNHLTLNVGYFARTPSAVRQDQAAWRQKFASRQLSDRDWRDNLFVTRDATFAQNLVAYYRVTNIDGFWIIDQLN